MPPQTQSNQEAPSLKQIQGQMPAAAESDRASEGSIWYGANTFGSPHIEKLASALCAAQGTFPTVTKKKQAVIKSDKGSYTYAYADLDDCWEAIRGPLKMNGLSILQMPQCDGRKVSVTTVLMHNSGQWLSGSFSLDADSTRAQAIGAAITYARRYGLTAAVGLTADADTDGTLGNDSQDRKKATQYPPTNRERPPQASDQEDQPPKSREASEGPPYTDNKACKYALKTELDKRGLDAEQHGAFFHNALIGMRPRLVKLGDAVTFILESNRAQIEGP